MSEKTTVPIYNVALGYTEEDEPQPFVAIGPLEDGTYAGYLVAADQLEAALADFRAQTGDDSDAYAANEVPA